MADAVAVAIESQPEILVYESLGAVAVVRNEERQRSQRFGLEALIGQLASLAVLAPVGNLLEPAACLRVHVAEIGKGA